MPWGPAEVQQGANLAYVLDLLVAREDSGDGDHLVHDEIGMLNVA